MNVEFPVGFDDSLFQVLNYPLPLSTTRISFMSGRIQGGNDGHLRLGLAYNPQKPDSLQATPSPISNFDVLFRPKVTLGLLIRPKFKP